MKIQVSPPPRARDYPFFCFLIPLIVLSCFVYRQSFNLVFLATVRTHRLFRPKSTHIYAGTLTAVRQTLFAWCRVPSAVMLPGGTESFLPQAVAEREWR